MRLRLHTALVVSCCVSACSVDDDPSPPGRLEVVQAPTTVVPGEPTAQTLIVRVLDDMGQSAQGVPVSWEVGPGSGSLRQSADTSGLDGLANSDWTPGLSQGEQLVSVSIYDQPALQIRVRTSVFHADRIAVSYRSGCGLAGSAVWCWDYAYDGTTASIKRVLPQLEVRDLAVGGSYVCVLDAAGSTFCQSTFGNPPPEGFFTIPGLPAIRDISAGGQYFCGIAISDATPWCWRNGALTGVQVSTTLQLASVSAASFHACGLTAAGVAWCWENTGSTPVLIPGSHSFRTLSAGQFFTCAIEPPAALFCWNRTDPSPQRVSGVAPSQVSMGTYSENLLNTGSGATMFHLYDFEPGSVYLESSSAFPIPSRQVADHCALAFDGTVYCSSRYNHSNSASPFTWAAIPEPAR
jgi:hypothetical protein